MKIRFIAPLSASIVFGLSTVSAQTLEVDWLYFTGNGSWLERSESLINEQTRVHLPVDDLSVDQFWWQTNNPHTQIIWAQPDPLGLPKKGSSVEISGEPGLWIIQDVSASHLVLQQGKAVRYWPQSQWHLLSWTSSTDFGMALSIVQPSPMKDEIFYAWQTYDVSAQVRYRLDESQTTPYLYQELIVSNLSDSDYSAPGYSYAQTSTQPVAMMRSMVMEDSFVSAPTASQSQGVPTLISNQPIRLAAGSHVWLPVSNTQLTKVERQYQMNWDSRTQGLQKAQSTIKLTSSTDLPDLAGPIKVGVFDQQIALLPSQYQPINAKEAELSMGQSALVTMNSKLVGEGSWVLDVDNRSQEEAVVELMINHWNGKTSQQVPMTVRIPAQSTKKVNLELGAGGLIRLPKS
jgi:hypothetical protein